MRPSLDSFKQASSNAFSKAQLMVGLNNSSTQNDDPRDDIELSNNNNSTDNNSNDNTNSDSGFRSSSFQRLFGHRGSEDDASSSSSLPGRGNNNNKDNSSSERTLMDEAADLVCPDLTFQQRLLGFVTCFTIACKYKVYTITNKTANSVEIVFFRTYLWFFCISVLIFCTN